MSEQIKKLILMYLDSWDQEYDLYDELYEQVIRYQGNEVSCQELSRNSYFDERMFVKEFNCKNGESFYIKYKDAISHYDGQLDNYEFEVNCVQLIQT